MLIQSSCLITSLDQKLKLVIKGIVQMHQSWGNNHVSGKPVLVYNILSVKKCFLMSILNVP